MSADAFKGRLRRPFTLRNAVKVLLWTATLIILFYAEENWRGSRMWAATKSKWEAKGESLDFNHFIPPPIPDAQNLGALPIFKLEPDQTRRGYLVPLQLEKALRGKLMDSTFPVSLGNWQRGERPDLGKLTAQTAMEYRQQFEGGAALSDSGAQLDALFPFLDDLREAAATKPLCRFPYDDTYDMPASRSLSLVDAQIKIARLFTLHALFALHQHQPELALADLKTIYQLLPGAARDPSFVGPLVALGMSSIAENAIMEGLTLHAWNDAQLAAIQDLLRKLDFLDDYQFALRVTATGDISDFNYFDAHRWDVQMNNWLGVADWPGEKEVWPFTSLPMRLFPLWPGGWMEQNKSQIFDYELNSLREVDPKGRRVFPGIVDELDGQILKASALPGAYRPWNFVFMSGAIGLAANTESLKFTWAQVWADLARIACGLERYRLVHGVYPQTLDALIPAGIAELPRDVVSGESYRYSLRPDGSFLLYSVGWNQKDDGGKVLFQKNHSQKIDEKQGDWVWPMPKVVEKSP